MAQSFARLRRGLLTAGLIISANAALVSGALASADPVQQQNSSALWFENWVGLSNATLTVSSPDGTVTSIEAVSGTPVFELERGTATDGIYRFELRAATEQTAKIVNQTDNGRGDAQRDSAAVPYYTTGHFIVERGVIVPPQDIKEEDG